MNAPDLVIHADWSIDGRKRRVARATLRPDGTYAVDRLSPAGNLAAEIVEHARAGCRVLAGFDFPIGLPAFFADRLVSPADGAADATFPAFLDRLGPDGIEGFGLPATRAEEIGPGRPFYPRRPGGTRRHHLVDALGASDFDALLRRCERRTALRSAASSLFWTLGAQQVGRAAVAGWREVIAPLRQRLGDGCAIWPFDGDLEACLASAPVVLAETYPAEIYGRLGFGRGWSKRRPADRAARGARILASFRDHGAIPSPAVAAVIENGFAGADDGGDDGFDAVVGLAGMLMTLRGALPDAVPADEAVRRWEGWILGQAPDGEAPAAGVVRSAAVINAAMAPLVAAAAGAVPRALWPEARP